MQIRRILYPVDFSATPPSGLAAAVSIARNSAAEVTLAHIVDLPYLRANQGALAFKIERYYHDTEVAAEARLGAVAADLPADVAVRTIVRRGDPATCIVELASEAEIDLLVMPTHARRGFERMLVGSVTEKVVRLAPCPVLTITPTGNPITEIQVRKILLPTDLSAPADEAASIAIDIAHQFGAAVMMLHIVTIGDQDPEGTEWGCPTLPEEHIASAVQMARQRLERRSAGASDDIEVSTRLVRGFDPAAEICRVADEEGFDLVVMEPRQRSGLMQALLGSTTAKVIRNHNGAVLTVREPT